MTVGRPLDLGHGGLVGGEDLLRIMPAAAQSVQLVRRSSFRPVPAAPGTCRRSARGCRTPASTVYFWYWPSTTSSIRLISRPDVVTVQQRVPVIAPDDLDHIPAGAAEQRLQLLDDLAVAANRAIQSLQVAVDDEDQVVQLFAGGQRDGAQRLRFVAFAVAQERPDLLARGVLDAAVGEVLVEPRLVDGHDRAQAHRDGGVLPEVGHQPGMRVRQDSPPPAASSRRKLLRCSSLSRPSRKARA